MYLTVRSIRQLPRIDVIALLVLWAAGWEPAYTQRQSSSCGVPLNSTEPAETLEPHIAVPHGHLLEALKCGMKTTLVNLY